MEDGIPITVTPSGHVIVGVTWPDQTTARALFDTGASLTVINQGFAADHPSLFSSRGNIGGVDADGKTAEMAMVTVTSCTLLGSSFPASLAVVADLNGIQLGRV